MTGNGIESDFVLPDSLFISDYSTMPAFYPHFGANCRFFCTISMSPDSSTLFPSRTLPEALPLDSAKGSSTLWTPVRAIQLVTLSGCARVFSRENLANCNNFQPILAKTQEICYDTPTTRRSS